MYGGPGANYTLLGDAGNFAYFAVAANIGVPLAVAEAAAGGYSVLNHPPRTANNAGDDELGGGVTSCH